MIIDCLKKEKRPSSYRLWLYERVKYHLVIAEHHIKAYRLELLEKKIYKLSKDQGSKQEIC